VAWRLRFERWAKTLSEAVFDATSHVRSCESVLNDGNKVSPSERIEQLIEFPKKREGS